MTDSHELSPSLVDGKPATHIPLTDRGFLYGDGLFETVRFVNARAPLWCWHWQRLRAGAKTLMLDLPAEALLLGECVQLAGIEECVVRVIVTRGDGNKPGYASGGKSSVRRIVMSLAMPPLRKNLKVGLCAQALSAAGVTAGMKHMARLEHVLLASEHGMATWDEGLVFDDEDQLCEALQANVLVLAGDDWLTPPVGAGVLGTARAAMLDLGWIKERPIARKDLASARALALCNGVRGIEPVEEVMGLRTFDTAPAEQLSRSWREKLATLDGADHFALVAGAGSSESC